MFDSLWSRISKTVSFFKAELSERERDLLLQIARAAIPGGSLVVEPNDETIRRFASQFESYRPAHRAALRSFLYKLEYGALLRNHHRFSRLDVNRQLGYLQAMHESGPTNRWSLRGLISLLKMAHFDNPTIFQAMGLKYQTAASDPIEEVTWRDRVRHLPDMAEDLELTTDVVIVGSGAGGAVVAKELAQQGLSVVVVEEGLLRHRTEYDGRPPTALNTMYRGGPAVFTVGNPPIWIPSGKVVGGTTAISFGTCSRPPDRVLHHWRRKFGLRELNPDNLSRYFERVESALEVAPADDQLLGGCARVIKRGCDAIGYTDHGPVSRCAPGCQASGTCMFGCPTGAKQSTDISYLPWALENGAELFTGARAHSILLENGEARGIDAHVPLRLRRHGVERKLRVRARIVVLACGAYATPALLLGNHLANSSGMVGHNLSLHPNATVLAEFDETIHPWDGIPQGYQLYDFKDQGVVFEGITTPLDLISLVYTAIGPEFTRLMESFNQVASFGFTIQDSSRGQVVRGPGGHPLVIYNLNRKDLERIKLGTRVLAEILFAAGAIHVYTPIHGFDRITGLRHLEQFRQSRLKPSEATLSAYHPLGTARMGVNPKKSVIGSDHECHDIPNLYVVDGSAIPSSLGVNPQLTIMALATRAADRLAWRF